MGKKGYASAFGGLYQQYAKYPLKYIKKYYEDLSNIEILLPNDFDGLHSLYTIKRNIKTTTYINNEILIHGGTLDGFKTVGILERANYTNHSEYLNLIEKNFYMEKVEKEYNFVFAYKPFNYIDNKNIPRDRMMRKLLSSVKENGFIYIYYHLAPKKNDYINYPKEEYFRNNEMCNYFDDSWEILDIKEMNTPIFEAGHPYNKLSHTHSVGHVFAKKKYKRRKYKYTYNISMDKS